MLREAEIGAKASKAVFAEREPELRLGLIHAQIDARKAGLPVLVLIAGDDRWGCNAAVDRLHEWFDPRTVRTEVFLEPHEGQRQRPPWWRYWRNLPERGQIGLFMGAWPARAIADRVEGRIDDALKDFDGWQQRIRDIIAATPKAMKWALHDRDPLPFWSRGRMTLLGDACHPMLPFMAQGTAQALEDVAVLVRCLAGHRLPDALQVWEKERWPRATGPGGRSRTKPTWCWVPC